MKKKLISAVASLCLLMNAAPVSLSVSAAEVSLDVFKDPVLRNDYIAKYDTDHNGKLSISENKNITGLYIKKNGKNVTDYSGIDYLINLKTLTIDEEWENNKEDAYTVYTIDLRGLTSLEQLYISAFKVNKLLLGDNDSLKRVSIQENNLSSLDLSGSPDLEVFGLLNDRNEAYNTNSFTDLVLGDKPKLKSFMIHGTDIPSLDFSGCTDLETLYLQKTSLRKLTLKDCSSLKSLYCPEAFLTSLDITDCINLEDLFCSDQGIRSITSGKNTKLGGIYAENNLLKEFDATKFPSLEALNISNNPIEKLDLSESSNLDYLNSDHCNLDSLDISKTLLIENAVSSSIHDSRFGSQNDGKVLEITMNAEQKKIWDSQPAFYDRDAFAKLFPGSKFYNENIVVSVAESLKIEKQPVSVTAKEGETVKFITKANGSGLSYQWYWKKPSDTSWSKCTGTGYSTDTLEVSAEAKRNGYQYYCKVNDDNGNSVNTDTVSLKVTSSLKITSQPASITVSEGATAKFTVAANGTGLTYQWYWRKPDGTWTKSTGTGYNRPTLEVAAEAKRNGYQYYCEVKDSSGRTVKSSTASLTVKTAFSITENPSNVTAAEGTTAKFTVKASGTSLKYQWQYSKDGGNTWSNSTKGNPTTAVLSVEAAASRNNYQYRCIVTSGTVSKTSSAAKLSVASSIRITSQPESVAAKAGTTVKFTAAASGTGLSYQWYWRKPEGTWAKSTGTGYNRPTLEVAAEAKRNGYQYYCEIKDSNGSVLKTSTAVLAVITVR